MANPRQRRKARSSSHKVVKQSKRANKLLKKQPPIRGPKVLQDAWDRHKTVRQNYAALGLAHTLTPMDSGGQDITHLHSVEKNQKPESRAQSDSSGVKEAGTTTERPNGFPLNERTGTKIPHGFGKLIRDESGAVVDVLLESEMHEDSESGEGAAVELELDDFEIARQPGSSGSDWLLRNRRGGNNEVLRALEDGGDTKVVRETSSAEIKYLSRLVEAHGEDYEAMAKDGKRNVSQYTSGQLRRGIAKAKAKA